ncbi:hypothetical protein KIN20_007573 [Parelaphostrongylus tenuis]|uniref:Uncharacterized protein n=1 Tax=Parelaphostrongylus tenuis TaxID=148309 RepID=A0AAD5M3L8_PARTN|nr:hypothetical protein KIN20_007573 [Parelaphostrongylus tenuis]
MTVNSCVWLMPCALEFDLKDVGNKRLVELSVLRLFRQKYRVKEMLTQTFFGRTLDEVSFKTSAIASVERAVPLATTVPPCCLSSNIALQFYAVPLRTGFSGRQLIVFFLGGLPPPIPSPRFSSGHPSASKSTNFNHSKKVKCLYNESTLQRTHTTD